MGDTSFAAPRHGLGELSVFLLAVIVGSLTGIATTMLLERAVSAATAGTAAVAVATTCTAATHARLAHGQPWARLLPKIAVGAPLAYGVMRVVHLLIGS